MQEVVPSAVRAAVMAATSTFISISQMLFFFMAHVFIEFVTSVDNLFGEDCAAFLPCHCPDEAEHEAQFFVWQFLPRLRYR